MPGNTGISAISATIPFGGAGGLVPWDIDPLTGVFTPAMRQTAGALFDRSPIAQGRWAATGVPDRVYVPRGTSLGNVVSGAVGNSFYSNFDYNQGAIAFLITPEWGGNDGKLHRFLAPYDTDFSMYKFTDSILYAVVGTRTITGPNVAAWTAGTTYLVILRWNCHNTLDGTNYGCISVNDVHTFGAATQPNVYSSGATWELFTDRNGVNSADAIVEAFCISRIPWYDGAYGVNTGQGDVLAEIYNGGSFRDPAEVVGSWDMTLMVPTNQADSALQAAGSAWSHPHGSNILDVGDVLVENCFACDALYGAEPYATKPAGANSWLITTSATFDDMPDGSDWTYEAWARAYSSGGQGNGWLLNKGGLAVCFYNNGNSFRATIPLQTTNAQAAIVSSGLIDDKWHHYAVDWEWATRTVKLYIDGRLADDGIGAGAYTTDAAADLKFGNTAANQQWAGVIGWHRFSNTRRYTGEFIPPRLLPGADGNTIEQWPVDEGTGATAAAVVASPANDLTLVGMTWIRTWDQELTPPILPVLEYDGAATSTVITDAARIQDLHTGAMCWEVWARLDTDGESSSGVIFSKSASGTTVGWTSFGGVFTTNLVIQSRVWTDAQAAQSTGYVVTPSIRPPRQWHHLCFQYDDGGDRKVYLWIDGIPCVYSLQQAATGNVGSDVGADLILGNLSSGIATVDGAFGGWARVSSVLRYTNGKAFVPPDMANPPAPDANTAWQTNFTDGAGTTLTDASAGANNGTITFGSGRWYNTPDAEIVASGHRMYPWGYWLHSDSAGDGIKVLTQTGLAAGSDYVGRFPIRYGYSRRAQPRIRIYDETNGATIVDFDGPALVGTHLVGAASANLVVTGQVFPYSLVGGVVYNITDQSSGTITAVGGTNQDTITAALAGGGSNDWNVGEQYMIVPPNESRWSWTEHFCWELPTVARNGVAADCTAYSVLFLDSGGEGTRILQQAEVQTNLVDNPSAETGAGNPWIPDGWANYLLDPGEAVQENAIVHSGSSSVEITSTASNEGHRLNGYGPNSGGTGTYCAISAWTRGDGGRGMNYYTGGSGRAVLQRSFNSALLLNGTDDDWWVPMQAVYRQVHVSAPYHIIRADGGATGSRYVDDWAAIALDPITLTVTPASEANSAESSGIRVDGRDTLTVPVPVGQLTATEGWPRVGIRPRHAAAILDDFGANNPTWLLLWGDATNYAMAYVSANNQVTLEFNDGGGVHTVNWNCAGAIATDTAYTLGIRWTAAQMELLIDELAVATIVQPVNFATIPTVAYCGCHQDGARQADAVFLAPGLV